MNNTLTERQTNRQTGYPSVDKPWLKYMSEESSKHQSIRTCDIQRNLPEWAKTVKTVNGLGIYNFNIFENIMS